MLTAEDAILFEPKKARKKERALRSSSFSMGSPRFFERKQRHSLKQIQMFFFDVLERPKKRWQIAYHVAVFVVVFGCLALSVVASVPSAQEHVEGILFFVEMLLIVWFMLELGLRVWSAGCVSRYQTFWGRLKFCRRPFCIMDIIIIAASISTLIVAEVNGKKFEKVVFFESGYRFGMMRLDRKASSWRLLASVVWAHRQELFTAVYIGFLVLIFASFLIFIAEKDANQIHFGTYADSLWWGVITLCTVGYGDAVPSTVAGKLIGAACAMIGISFFALPAGILGSGFALKVQQQQRQKHQVRRRQPAAVMIQALWRLFMVENNRISDEQWQYIISHYNTRRTTLLQTSSQVDRIRPSSRRKPSVCIQTTSSIDEAAQGSAFTNCVNSPNGADPNSLAPGASTPDMGTNPVTTLVARSLELLRPNEKIPGPNSIALTRNPLSQDSISENNTPRRNVSADSESAPMDKSDIHKKKLAYCFLRKLKYLVARKRFREALRPYDLKDVIEQYSAGNIDMLSRIKNLQGRLDEILGKQGSQNKNVYYSNITLASRIVKVERQVEDIDYKLDQLIGLYSKQLSTRPMGGDSSNRPSESESFTGEVSMSVPQWPASNKADSLSNTQMLLTPSIAICSAPESISTDHMQAAPVATVDPSSKSSPPTTVSQLSIKSTEASMPVVPGLRPSGSRSSLHRMGKSFDEGSFDQGSVFEEPSTPLSNGVKTTSQGGLVDHTIITIPATNEASTSADGDNAMSDVTKSRKLKQAGIKPSRSELNELISLLPGTSC